MTKNLVFTSLEFRRMPSKLKNILRKIRKFNPETRAIMIAAYVGIPVAAEESGYRFDILLEILKARARIYCPFCQKKVSRKKVLEKGIKKVKSCTFCKGKGSLTGVEIEKIKLNLGERR